MCPLNTQIYQATGREVWGVHALKALREKGGQQLRSKECSRHGPVKALCIQWVFNKCQWMKELLDGEDGKVEENHDKWSTKPPEGAREPEYSGIHLMAQRFLPRKLHFERWGGKSAHLDDPHLKQSIINIGLFPDCTEKVLWKHATYRWAFHTWSPPATTNHRACCTRSAWTPQEQCSQECLLWRRPETRTHIRKPSRKVGAQSSVLETKGYKYHLELPTN